VGRVAAGYLIAWAKDGEEHRRNDSGNGIESGGGDNSKNSVLTASKNSK